MHNREAVSACTHNVEPPIARYAVLAFSLRFVCSTQNENWQQQRKRSAVLEKQYLMDREAAFSGIGHCVQLAHHLYEVARRSAHISDACPHDANVRTRRMLGHAGVLPADMLVRVA